MRNAQLEETLKELNPSAIRQFHNFLIDTLTSERMRALFHEQKQCDFFDLYIDDLHALELTSGWAVNIEIDGTRTNSYLSYCLSMGLDDSGSFILDCPLSDMRAIYLDGADMIELLDRLQEMKESLGPVQLELFSNE